MANNSREEIRPRLSIRKDCMKRLKEISLNERLSMVQVMERAIEQIAFMGGTDDEPETWGKIE